MRRLKGICSSIATVIATGLCTPASALEGVYGGPECLTMRFDFRANGQVFATEPGGRERGGTYRDAGDRIAITLPNDPGLVLARSGDALTLTLPRTPISPETTLRCIEIVDVKTAKALPPDSRMSGCWQVDGQSIVDQAGLPPREVPAPKNGVCQAIRDANRVASRCRKDDGTVMLATESTSKRIGANVTTTKVVRNEVHATFVGQEAMQHYSVSGDQATIVVYGAESSPISKVFKTSIRSHRVDADKCIAKLP